MTKDAVLCFTESIRKEIANTKNIHAVLVDLSKAFNSISLEFLLGKKTSPKLFIIFNETN